MNAPLKAVTSSKTLEADLAVLAFVTLVMAACVSAFIHLEWGRFELWVLALVLAGLVRLGAIGHVPW